MSDNNAPSTSRNPSSGSSTGSSASAPIIQFDHKKTPCFYGNSKDTLTPVEWVARIDQMKTTQDWTDEQTFANAKGALFDVPAKWASFLKQSTADYAENWTFLKKAFLKRYGPSRDDRSYIDALFLLKPRTDFKEDLDDFFADIFQTFQVMEETVPQPTIVVGGPFTANDYNRACKEAWQSVMEHLKVAFMLNLMVPEIRKKIQDKNPANVKDVVKLAYKAQLDLINEKKPLGARINEIVPAPSQPSGLADIDESDIKAVVSWYRSNRGRGGAQQGRGTKRGGQQSRGGQSNQGGRGGQNSQGSNPNKGLHCTYCNKMNHHQEICYRRQKDNMPCYTTKGQPYWPKVNAVDPNHKGAEKNDGVAGVLPSVTLDFQ